MQKNLKLFASLGDGSAAKNIILVTTKWSNIRGDVGERREREIYDEHWSEMLGLGSRVVQFDNNRRSAWDIVNLVLEGKSMEVNLIQTLVKLRAGLPESRSTVKRIIFPLSVNVSILIKLEIVSLLTSPQ
jgi:hypothetical protein